LAPTVGEPVIWMNFDVRAYSGVYEIQINDNSGDAIGWALYASTAPTSGVAQNPETGEWLSGDASELMFMSEGPGWSDIAWVVDACEGVSVDETGTAAVADADDSCASSGCSYVQAINYSPLATRDAGYCQFAGCTDVTALNYSPHANLDDGSCAFQWCPDFTGNGAVQVNDFMSLLSVFGLTYGPN